MGKFFFALRSFFRAGSELPVRYWFVKDNGCVLHKLVVLWKLERKIFLFSTFIFFESYKVRKTLKSVFSFQHVPNQIVVWIGTNVSREVFEKQHLEDHELVMFGNSCFLLYNFVSQVIFYSSYPTFYKEISHIELKFSKKVINNV